VNALVIVAYTEVLHVI